MAVRTATVEYVGDAASLIRASQQASAAAEAATAKIAGANEKMATSAARAAATVTKVGHDVALGFAGAAAESVHLAMKMEGVTASIAAAGGSSVAAAEKIKAAFLSTAGTALFSAEKQGEAFAKVAGELKAVEGHTLTAAQATKVMSAAMALTEATGGDLVSTTESLGQVMKTYGLHSSQAAEASDVLFNASKQTGTSVETLAQTVDRIRGRLGALSPTLKESAGLMVDLSKHGVTGRLVMGALGGTFNTLLGQGKGVTAMAKQLNLHIFDSHGKFVGLKSVIGQLNPELSKYTQASQLAATKVLFGSSANKVMLDLIHQGPQAYQAATVAVAKHGAAEEAAKRHADTFGGQVKKLRAALEDYATIVGEKLVPVLKFMVTGLQDGVKWLKNHEAAAIALTGVIGTVLGGALLVFASSKAKKFIGATQDMISASKTLAERIGLSSKAVEGSFAGQATAAETAAGKTAAAEAGLAKKVGETDATIAAENKAAGASFTKMLGPIAAVLLAIEGLKGPAKEVAESLEEVFGGKKAKGEVGGVDGLAKKFDGMIKKGEAEARGNSTQKNSDTGGGIMSYFMSKGLTPAQAAGIVGNAQQESGLNPSAPGGGLFQYIGSRAASGKGGAYEQLEATWRELNGAYKDVLVAIKKARTPQEAARIFERGFEHPEPGSEAKRQQYAREAYAKHPQSHHTAAQHAAQHARHAEEYGTATLPESTKAAKHRKAVEAYMDPFAGATGVHRSRTDQGVDFSFGGRLGAIGPGVIEKVKNFQGFGETIVELLTGGSHKGQRIYTGLETGGKGLVHAGQHVRAGQAIARGYGRGGIEMGFAGPDGLPVVRYGPGQSHSIPTAGGEAFSKFLASIGKSGSSLQLATAQLAEAEAHLLLSPHQAAAVRRNKLSARADHAAVSYYSERAEEAGSSLEARQARWNAIKQPLTSAAGAHNAMAAAGEVVSTDKAEKRYYEQELKALKKEVKEWGQLRDHYRSFARHVHGNAKKEALNKASGYQKKIEQAQKDAKALKGTIYSTETKLIEAESAAGAVPGEIAAANTEAAAANAEAAKNAEAKAAEGLSNDLSAYQAANNKIDMEERAKMFTPEQAKAAKEANAQKALAGGFGALSEEGILQVKGDLVEFSKTVQEANGILEQHNQLQKETNKLLDDFNKASGGLLATENASLIKSLADMMNGNIGGRPQAYGAGRGAFAGSAVRY